MKKGIRKKLFGLLDPEDEDSTNLQNVRNYLHNDSM
jgi:hypothetical protein